MLPPRSWRLAEGEIEDADACAARSTSARGAKACILPAGVFLLKHLAESSLGSDPGCIVTASRVNTEPRNLMG